MFDPIELSQKVEKIVCKNNERLYGRFRPARFYGGISSGDACGCNLRCIFCWGWRFVTQPKKYGKFYSAEEVAKKLIEIAEKFNFKLLRITGAEPTIGKKHLIKVLEIIDQKDFNFILETNGILIGYDKNYAKDLSNFKSLHVRVSIKGTNEEEFSKLTFAKPEAFQYQLNALKNLLDEGVSCHPSIMLSFSKEENYKKLLERLKEIDKKLVREIEEEYVFLYPHVVKKLEQAKIKPLKAFSPNNVPNELI